MGHLTVLGFCFLPITTITRTTSNILSCFISKTLLILLKQVQENYIFKC